MLSIKFPGRPVNSGKSDEEPVAPFVLVPSRHILAVKRLKFGSGYGGFIKLTVGKKGGSGCSMLARNIDFHFSSVCVQDAIDAVPIVMQDLDHHGFKQLAS
jgi:hypothetical protein